MTVQNQNVKNVYRGNGSTTEFPFTFAINADHPEYIHVYITNDGEQAVETTDFTCDMENRTITYPKISSSAPKLSATQRLTVYRLLPYEQNLNLVNQGPFFSEDVEQTFDDQEMQIQQLNEEKERSLRVGLETTNFDTVIPLAAGKTFRVKDDGSGFEVTEDPAVAMRAAQDAQAAAERAQGAAEDAQEAAERAQGKAEDAKDDAETAAALAERHMTWFDTLADMKAEDIPAGMTAATKGYFAINDGGNGKYHIRAAVPGETYDNGSKILLDNGNVAELINDGSVNVKQFGAYGDGTHEDTVAFANALAFAQGKIFTVPNGIYNITSQLFVDNVSVVNDCGTYNAIKPCYPATGVLFESVKQLSLVQNISIDNDKSVQGICYNSDTDKLIIGIKNGDDSAQKLLVVDPSDYTVSATYSYTELGHVNSLTYNNKTKKIYAIYHTYKVAIIDGSTMAYEGSVTLDNGNANVFALKYDKESDIYVGYYQGTGSQTFYIRHFDSSFNLIAQYSSTGQNFGTMNGMMIHDGIVFFGSYTLYIQCDYFARNVRVIESLGSYEFEDACYCERDNKFYLTYIPSYSSGLATLATFTKGKINSRGFFGEAGKAMNKYDLNNIVEPGVYDVDPLDGNRTTLHYPYGNGRGFLYVGRVDGLPNIGSGMQVFITFTADSRTEMYARNRIASPNVGGTWGDWRRLDVKGRNVKASKTRISYTDGSSAYSYTATSDGMFEFRCSCSGLLQLYVNNKTSEYIIQGSGVKAASVPVKKGDTIGVATYGGASGIEAYFSPFEYEP